jgi:hypothetical protein
MRSVSHLHAAETYHVSLVAIETVAHCAVRALSLAQQEHKVSELQFECLGGGFPVRF